MMESGPGWKVHHAVVARASAKLRFVFFRESFNQDMLRRAHHRLADRAPLAVQLLLQAAQALGLFFAGGLVRQLGGGGSRPRAVDKGKGGIEMRLARKLERRLEVGFGLAG